MKLQGKMLAMVAFLVLAMPMMAGAVPVGTYSSNLNYFGQTFYGDGAMYGNGYLQAPPINPSGDKCLDCHQKGGPGPDKTSYLRTGHGNMVLKVTSPPQKWGGPEGELYKLTNPYGHPINWTTGKVDLGGQCDVGGFEGQFNKATCESTTACTLAMNNFFPASPGACTLPDFKTKATCEAGGGQWFVQYTKDTCEAAGGKWKKGKWTAGTRLADISWLIGPWMSIDQPDTGITGAGLPPFKFFMADGRQYGTCGSCHNAGYKAGDYSRPQPFASIPNYPADYKNYPRSGVAGSWVLNGIQCERCHDATKHYSSPSTVSVPRGAASTALCSQCHIRPASWEGSETMLRDGYVTTINNPNAASAPTAYPIGASATNFGGHLIGKQFLNSPHGLFSGPFDHIPVTNAGLYKSRFREEDGSQGGCATCHDVHQTTVVKMYPEEPPHEDAALSRSSLPLAVSAPPVSIRKGCVECHTDKEDLATLRHPNGAGTPQEEGAHVIDEACKSCHMPKPGGTGLYVHVFRINTNPFYSTFPAAGATTPGYCSDPFYKTRADCLAASKSWSLVANSAPDGDYKNAVWVDLDLACGKCHGSGGEARPLSKLQTAEYAKGIHGVSRNPNSAPTAAMTGLTVTGSTVTFKDNSTDVEDPQYKLRIAVNWGDGTIESGQPGGTFQHTYDFAGTFTVRRTVTDTGGMTGYESVSVSVTVADAAAKAGK